MKIDKAARREIAQAIKEAEDRTSGEICVHIQSKCRGDVLEYAKMIFLKLKMHRTRKRNGVLIFIALDSRLFALLGDTGIHERVGDAFWDETRDIMTSYFADGRIKEGLIAAVRNTGDKLKTYFPFDAGDVNELPDRVSEG